MVMTVLLVFVSFVTLLRFVVNSLNQSIKQNTFM